MVRVLSKTFLKILTLVICVFLLTSCATILKPMFGKQTKIITTPEGGIVKLNGKDACKAPCTLIPDDKKPSHEIQVSLEGYKSSSYTIEKGFFWPFWVDVGFGPYGAIGALIDWATGSMWVFKPRKINHIFTSLKEDEEEVEDAEDEKENQSIEPPKLTTPIENKSQIIVAPAAVPSAEPAPSPTTEPKPNLKEGDNGESGNVKEVDAPIPIETRRRVVEAFYNDHIDDVIRQYYGAISKKELTAIRARLRRILAEQEIRGERMDLDAAIMLDHSRTQ